MKLKKSGSVASTTVPTVTEKETKKATKKSTGSKATSYTQADIGRFAGEYAELSKQIKALEEKKKNLSELIKAGAEQFGTKDDKGSFYLEVNGYVAGKIAKMSMSIDQDAAVPFLKKKGLADVIDKIETVNQERLEKAVGAKRLTLNDVESFTNKKVSYQVSVKELEEMPEVEQSNLAPAAKRK